MRFSPFAVALLVPALLTAQRQPGKPIGKVSVMGNLIHLELDSGAVTPARPFDLDHRTLRFTPDGAGYRVENVSLVWDADFGAPLTESRATLKNFTFPFSGKTWDAFNIATGSVTFGAAQAPGRGGGGGVPAGNRTGAGFSGRSGFYLERYPTLQTVGHTFINMVPGIAAFVRVAVDQRSAQRFVKETADRAVVTWSFSEPVGGIQAFTWTPTVNRVQTVLHKNGTIELSYNDVSVRDGIVGVFPTVNAGTEKRLTTVTAEGTSNVAANLNVKRVTYSAVDGVFLKATIETRGPIIPESDPAINGVTYRIGLSKYGRQAVTEVSKSPVVWTIRGIAGGRGGGGRGGSPRYVVSGNGADPEVTIEGNTISIKGTLPGELAGASEIAAIADAGTATPTSTNVADMLAVRFPLGDNLRSPELDLSATAKKDGPFAVAYEGFHWMEIPRAQDVTCSVIKALGDKYDFFAMYSDFRVDNPEGGTPSTGPRGGNVSGIGTNTNGLENYCSQGQLQWMFVEPVSTSAVQIQERSPDGRMTKYDYAVSQIAHELGHRWAANARAIVNGETIDLGPTHWGRGVHLQAAFPYGRPEEADIMGGSTWKENGDGTFTQLDRDYYNPAKGWSWLALYLMGLAKPDEVKPFFILRNLQATGQQDAGGHPIFRGDKTVITIENVIAAMGPRSPDFDHAQKKFNTAIVVMTEPGKKPTKELIAAANNIADLWIPYWSKTTGGRSTMTVTPK